MYLTDANESIRHWEQPFWQVLDAWLTSDPMFQVNDAISLLEAAIFSTIPQPKHSAENPCIGKLSDHDMNLHSLLESTFVADFGFARH